MQIKERKWYPWFVVALLWGVALLANSFPQFWPYWPCLLCDSYPFAV